MYGLGINLEYNYLLILCQTFVIEEQELITFGATPYGFSTSVDLTTRVRSKVTNEEEMKVIDLIRNYHNDKLSPSVICENLNFQEIKCMIFAFHIKQ
jgi:hypothetical protein